jgi:glutathione synthase/RimK-type ligase-like ATP-grasp enzyme
VPNEDAKITLRSSAVIGAALCAVDIRSSYIFFIEMNNNGLIIL